MVFFDALEVSPLGFGEIPATGDFGDFGGYFGYFLTQTATDDFDFTHNPTNIPLGLRWKTWYVSALVL